MDPTDMLEGMGSETVILSMTTDEVEVIMNSVRVRLRE